MKLMLKIIGQKPDEQLEKIEFGIKGGTLGRSQNNNWVLIDPFVSRSHARISADESNFYVEDTDSQDGTFVNRRNDEGLEPYTPYALKTGDRLFIGDIEILVIIKNERDVEEVETDVPIEAIENIKEKVIPRREKPEKARIGTDWYKKVTPSDDERDEPLETVNEIDTQDHTEDEEVDERQQDVPQVKSAIQALLRGAGMDDISIDSIDEGAACYAAGSILRETVEGLAELMRLRIQFKEEFLRVDRTKLSLTENNPLKNDKLTTDDILRLLFKEAPAKYQPLPDAVAEALEDTRTHLVAVVLGMQSAFDGLLDRLDPKRVEEGAQSDGGSGFLPGKRKVWDVYCEIYDRIADGDFYQTFGNDFVRAYGDAEQAAETIHEDKGVE